MDMTSSLGRLNLKAFRYGVIGVFLVCNALIASLAVWNLGLVDGPPMRVPLLNIDSYLTFVGSSGLVLIFVVGFVELTHKYWFLGRVWFECAWVALWGLMYSTGGIALTAIASQQDCTTTSHNSRCVSAQVLLAFTWICALTLIIYFTVFMFAIFINKKKDPTIWQSMTRKFPWSGTCAILSSAPPTPVLPRFRTTVPIIHAPKPKHARPKGGRRERIFSYRSGLSQEYQIEHYRPPSVIVPTTRRSRVLEPPAAAALPVIRPPALPPIDADAADSFVSSLYPMYMRQAIIDSNPDLSRPQPTLTHAAIGAAHQVARAPVQAALPPSPPPLGHWPRPDVISQPVSRGKRKPPAALRLDHSSRDVDTWRRQVNNAQPGPYSPGHPVGPRRRSGSADMTRQMSPLA